MEIVSVEKAKKIDKETIEKIKIPSIVLMENAAQNIYNHIVHKGNSFIFFCGVGNNGGDGLAIARKLYFDKKDIKIYIVGDLQKASKEFTINFNILLNMKVDIKNVDDTMNEEIEYEISDTDIVIDSIMGVGLNRNIKGGIYELIQIINRKAKYVISVDNPTGFSADTGQELGIAVKATETYVIEVLKKGYFNLGAKEYLGKINLVKIGIPDFIKKKYSEDTIVMHTDEYKNFIPRRNIYGHKGEYGRVLILAGSVGMTGAAYITTEAVIKSGAGLVTLVVEREIQDILSSKLIEAMTVNYEEKEKIDMLINNADVIICGPGLGKREKNREMLYKFIKYSNCPMILDADALNIISDDMSIISELRNRAVFTPHVGEMSKLTSKDIKCIEYNRIDECRKFANKNKIINLLKGFNTVISDGDTVVVNNTGNSKMSSGGMGDCLTGLIGGLAAQGISLYDSAKLGAFIHGAIGDELGKDRYVVMARDIIDQIPKFIERMLRI